MAVKRAKYCCIAFAQPAVVVEALVQEQEQLIVYCCDAVVMRQKPAG